MIRAHLLTWVCGKAVWVWRWVTLAQFQALPHVDQVILARKIAHMAAATAIGLCAAGGAWFVPKMVASGHGPLAIVRAPIVTASPGAQVVNVPEPGTLLILGSGFVLLWGIRRV